MLPLIRLLQEVHESIEDIIDFDKYNFRLGSKDAIDQLYASIRSAVDWILFELS